MNRRMFQLAFPNINLISCLRDISILLLYQLLYMCFLRFVQTNTQMLWVVIDAVPYSNQGFKWLSGFFTREARQELTQWLSQVCLCHGLSTVRRLWADRRALELEKLQLCHSQHRASQNNTADLLRGSVFSLSSTWRSRCAQCGVQEDIWISDQIVICMSEAAGFLFHSYLYERKGLFSVPLYRD